MARQSCQPVAVRLYESKRARDLATSESGIRCGVKTTNPSKLYAFSEQAAGFGFAAYFVGDKKFLSLDEALEYLGSSVAELRSTRWY